MQLLIPINPTDEERENIQRFKDEYRERKQHEEKLRRIDEREQIRQKFIERARQPPYDVPEWSDAWRDYIDEMRNLEQQLRDAGEVL